MKKLWIYLVFVSIVSSLFLAVSVQAAEAIIQDENDQKMTLIIKKANSSDGNEPIPQKKNKDEGRLPLTGEAYTLIESLVGMLLIFLLLAIWWYRSEKQRRKLK